VVGPPSRKLMRDGFLIERSRMDKGMRIIFIIMGACILAGVLCVIFAVTHRIS
jgi:hypothetical protein